MSNRRCNIGAVLADVVNSAGGAKVSIRPLITQIPGRTSAFVTRSHARLLLLTAGVTVATVWLVASQRTPSWAKLASVATLGGLLAVGCLFAFPYARVWKGDETLTTDDFKAANDIRTMLIGLIGAVFALSSVFFTYQTARQAESSAARLADQQLAADRRALLRDQFSQGAELIESKTLEVRMAGLLVLDELLNENDPIQRQTLVLLNSYVRSRAKWAGQRRHAWLSTSDAEKVAAEASRTFGVGSLRKRAQDVQAALGSLSKLDKSKLHGGKQFRVDLRDADLQGAELGWAYLQGAKFAGAHLDYADSRTKDGAANLEGADFQGATMFGIHLDRAKLAKATFRTPLRTASGVDTTLRTEQTTDLRNSHFVGADLTGANFLAANLGGAELRKATLVGANFTEADLRGARLEGADLTGADLTMAKLDGVTYDSDTRWPAGFYVPPNRTRIEE